MSSELQQHELGLVERILFHREIRTLQRYRVKEMNDLCNLETKLKSIDTSQLLCQLQRQNDQIILTNSRQFDSEDIFVKV
jgi:hypothetical protein